MRAALYLRVSTTRQAEKDLSIPDQQRQGEAFCREKGWEVVTAYVERGASATDDKRLQFQKMISDATDGTKPFDVIVVHSFSRFFRDQYQFEFYRRRLLKRGVALVSITQDLGDDPSSDLLRNVCALFDEYQSRENAKHVLRAMKENARQGFWNGSVPPFGYRTVVAEWRGEKPKKKLEINPRGAETVRLIFRLYTHGPLRKGPIGIKTITEYLNSRNVTGEAVPYCTVQGDTAPLRNVTCGSYEDNPIRTYGPVCTYREGKRFSIQKVATILGSRTYVGTHYFNRRDSRTGKPKKRSEWIEVSVPPIIDTRTYETTQTRLKNNNPKKTLPRIVNSPTLLTPLARCGTCGGPMRLRTGKGGKYRYYTCAKRADQGKTVCTGLSISMPKLDDIVINALTDRIFKPERLEEMLGQLLTRNVTSQEKTHAEVKALKRDKRELTKRLDNLYEAIETGGVDADKRLGERIKKLQSEIDHARALVSSKERQLAAPHTAITPKKLAIFAQAMRDHLTGNDPAFRKAYIRLFIDEVRVRRDEIRITGPKNALLQAAVEPPSADHMPVRTFVQEWRPRRDSNARPPD